MSPACHTTHARTHARHLLTPPPEPHHLLTYPSHHHTGPRLSWVRSWFTVTLHSESLKVGDIIIFDGDVVHRGCTYDGLMVAAHIYLDVPGVTRAAPNEYGSFNKGV